MTSSSFGRMGILAWPKLRAAVAKRSLLSLGPAVIFLILFFVTPVMQVLIVSVRDSTGWTFQYYAEALGSARYLTVLATTGEIAAISAIITLFMGFPLAYLMAFGGSLVRSLVTVAVLLPFITSLLVRTYAWMIILSPNGIATSVLKGLHLGNAQLLYNRAGVLIGMIYILLPYMVLTLSSVMSSIDASYLRAARTLGANGWRTFTNVFLPLSLPGIATGCLLVFVLAIGYFMTPRLMGGPNDVMISMSIDTQVEQALNWHLASALSVILLAFTLGTLWIYTRLVGFDRLLEMSS